MHDKENAVAIKLAFQLGKTTRLAMHGAGVSVDEAALAKFAESLLEAGEDEVPPDLLLVFVSGFHETIPVPERRVASPDGVDIGR